MPELQRPRRVWESGNGKRRLARSYLKYLCGLLRINEEEKQELQELGVQVTPACAARIEDPDGTAAFIEGIDG